MRVILSACARRRRESPHGHRHRIATHARPLRRPDDRRRPGGRRATRLGAAPDAEHRRRSAGLRRGGLRRHAGPGRLPRVRQRRRRGVDGRRDRGLVRGHRAVQAPAGAADPAHGADPEAQGRARPRAWRSSSARTSCRRTSSASGSRSAAPSRRLGEWLCEPANAQRVVDEVAEVAAIALSKVRDEHIESLVRDALTPRFREEPISPLLGGLLSEALRDNLHHGLVDLALDRAARLAAREPGHRRGGARRAGPVVGAAAAQRGGHRPDPRRAGPLGRRHPRRPAPPRPAGARLRARPARPGPAVATRTTQARAEALKERLLDHPAVVTSFISLWDALRRALTTSLEDPTGRRPPADAHRGDARSPTG